MTLFDLLYQAGFWQWVGILIIVTGIFQTIQVGFRSWAKRGSTDKRNPLQ